MQKTGRHPPLGENEAQPCGIMARRRSLRVAGDDAPALCRHGSCGATLATCRALGNDLGVNSFWGTRKPAGTRSEIGAPGSDFDESIGSAGAGHREGADFEGTEPVRGINFFQI